MSSKIYKVFDLHCDTISAICERRQQGQRAELRQNHLKVDLEKLKDGHYGLQTFALFLDAGQEKDCFQKAKELLRLFQGEMEKNKDQISQVATYKEIEENEKSGKLSALLSLEEGAIFQELAEQLQWFREQGVRIATFTWNYENLLGYPNRFYDPIQRKVWSEGDERGLKERGIQALELMEAQGIIPDVSHLSDGGFRDVAEHAKKPFIATHSNSRSMAPNAARNLTDEMIRTLAEKGGIMGLNYCVSFVRPDWRPGQEGARLDELAAQAEHIIKIGGEDCLGLGSDFDGIEEAPEMENAGGMQRLAEAMEKAGLASRQIEKIFSGNVKRFLKENL